MSSLFFDLFLFVCCYIGHHFGCSSVEKQSYVIFFPLLQIILPSESLSFQWGMGGGGGGGERERGV